MATAIPRNGCDAQRRYVWRLHARSDPDQAFVHRPAPVHVLVARARCAQALQFVGVVVRFVAVARCGGSNFWLAARALAVWNGLIALSFTGLLWWFVAPETYLPYGSSLEESIGLGIFFEVLGAACGPVVRLRLSHSLRLSPAQIIGLG